MLTVSTYFKELTYGGNLHAYNWMKHKTTKKSNSDRAVYQYIAGIDINAATEADI